MSAVDAKCPKCKSEEAYYDTKERKTVCCNPTCGAVTPDKKPRPLSRRMRQCLWLLVDGAKLQESWGWWLIRDGHNRQNWTATGHALKMRGLISQDHKWDWHINAAGLAALRAWEGKYQDTWESLGHGIIEVEPKDE